MGLAWAAAEEDQLERSAFLLRAAEQANRMHGRKTFFEYDYFYQPVWAELHAQLDEKYQPIIDQGRDANLDEVIKELLMHV